MGVRLTDQSIVQYRGQITVTFEVKLQPLQPSVSKHSESVWNRKEASSETLVSVLYGFMITSIKNVQFSWLGKT